MEKEKCHICGNKSVKIFDATIMKRTKVNYYRCAYCSFIQTEEPYWLEEAYKTPINISDTGILKRNLSIGFKTALVITLFLDRKNKFLDYSGGYGILTRFMRDLGLDYYWNDPYTENKLVRGFEGEKGTKYEAITLVEAFEHFTDPLNEIEKLLKMTDTIIFSTFLVPKPTPKPNEWWYYGVEHGQHISLYSIETLEYIAKKYNYKLYSNKKSYHVLTKRTFPRILFKLVVSPISILLLPLIFIFNKSKTMADNEKIRQKLK